jgi:hypothetical protein
MSGSTSDSKLSDGTQDTSGCFLIVTVTKVECQAVLKIFCPSNEWSRRHIEKKTYYYLVTLDKTMSHARKWGTCDMVLSRVNSCILGSKHACELLGAVRM